MKKILILLTITFGLILGGCTTDSTDDVELYTEEELLALIEELIPQAEVTTSYDLSSFENAITEIKKAQELDPLMPLYYAFSIAIHGYAGRYY